MTENEQVIYDSLLKKYNKSCLSPQELADELGLSYSTIHNYIKRGYGTPNFIRLGHAKNAKIIFNLVDISKFLCSTIITL